MQVWQDPVLAQASLVAWCESRNEFRSFGLDRMVQVQRQSDKTGLFRDEPDKTLADYLRAAAPAGARNQLDG